VSSQDLSPGYYPSAATNGVHSRVLAPVRAHQRYWLHALLWGTLTVALALGLLQPVKGAIVGWQWAQYMHGFDPDDEEHDAPPGQERRTGP